jgi:hypothetical protein
MALDTAELLASLAAIIGADRAVATAAAVIGPEGVAAAVPLLQPLLFRLAPAARSPATTAC